MLEEIEKYAKEYNVPIMQKDGIEFLTAFIKDNNVKNILEIGTAIGYSAIKMALVDKSIKVTTIERDVDRYNLAIENIKSFNLENQINPILADALDIDIKSNYDLIFIDAAKSQSIKFFNKFEKLLNNKGYIITLDANEDVYVYADKEKISQVLYNLIGNAINYTGEDKRVHLRQTTAESIVMVEVCDTGDGIEPEKLPQIWERYYRADKFHRRSEIGMGIGLSIVRDILDAHNAAFGVSSKLGAGSVFWFKLHTK